MEIENYNRLKGMIMGVISYGLANILLFVVLPPKDYFVGNIQLTIVMVFILGLGIYFEKELTD